MAGERSGFSACTIGNSGGSLDSLITAYFSTGFEHFDKCMLYIKLILGCVVKLFYLLLYHFKSGLLYLRPRFLIAPKFNCFGGLITSFDV